MAELWKTRDGMQHKFDTLHEEIVAGKDDATKHAVKKLRVDRGYAFKKKGHEHQFHFNTKIEEQNSESSDGSSHNQTNQHKGTESTEDPPTTAERRYSSDRIATKAYQGSGQV